MKNYSDLELVKIIKCFYRTGTTYYATFEAKDKLTSFTRTYQAKVYRDHYTRETTVMKFRLRPESQNSDA